MDPDDTADYAEPVIALAPMEAENVMAERYRDKEPSHWTTAVRTAKVLGAAGLLCVGYGAWQGLSSGAPKTEGKLISAGTSTLESYSSDIDPFTIGTAVSQETGERVAYHYKATNPLDADELLSYEIPAQINTQITVDPNHVDILYDVRNKHLTYDLSHLALSAHVFIPTGGAQMIKPVGGRWPGAQLQNMAAEYAAGAEALATGKYIDPTKIPLIGNSVRDTDKIINDLRLLGEYQAVVNNDKECTKLLPKEVEGFDKSIDENAKTVIRGKLLDNKNKVEDKVMSKNLASLMALSGTEIREIADKATVKRSPHDAIGLDQSAIKQLDGFLKSHKYSSVDTKSVGKMKCNVNKDTANLSVIKSKGTK